ncbi:MAG TPA: dockerin type I domain-containing protein [Phycisphaerales bacterium]|nr:dockerin type I domain-containing protein [Phycisphaerales bacterium]
MRPSSVANNINQNGDICGWMGTVAAGAFPAHAFVWRNGKVTDIGVLAGANNSQATALNDVGQVAGRATFGTSATGFTQRGWFWEEGTGMVELCTECTQSYVYDMNDAGQVVGFAGIPNAPLVGAASIWEKGKMRLLGTMTDLPTGMLLLHAYGINNAGQITGDAMNLNGNGDLFTFILTPIPTLAGDTNCDHVVNIDDLTAVILHWGSDNEDADVNEDGVVDSGDLMEVIANWSMEDGG